MKSLFDKIPGQGSRTIVAVILLVLVGIADLFGASTEVVDPKVVGTVEFILAGLAAIFAKLGIANSVKN